MFFLHLFYLGGFIHEVIICSCRETLNSFGFFTLPVVAEGLSEDKQKRHFIGYRRLTTNDVLGDGKDRWRTGSFSSSRIWGQKWKGELPQEFAELVEARFLGEIIAPSDLSGKSGIDDLLSGI